MQTQEKTLNELVTELGFTASFHELPASYKRPEWAVKYEKRAVIAKLTFRGNSFSFPYYYGTQKTENIEPTPSDLVWPMGTESSSVNELSFADFCREFDYNPDSMRDGGIYSSMKQRATKWSAFLNDPKIENELITAGNDY